jgi:hypothetical protein
VLRGLPVRVLGQYGPAEVPIRPVPVQKPVQTELVGAWIQTVRVWVRELAQAEEPMRLVPVRQPELQAEASVAQTQILRAPERQSVPALIRRVPLNR